MSTLLFIFPNRLGQLLPELRHTLAFLPMTVLRSSPMNLLAFDAAVAVRLACLAQLAGGRDQRGAAHLAGLS